LGSRIFVAPFHLHYDTVIAKLVKSQKRLETDLRFGASMAVLS
jgi:hypothetical protein